MSDTNLSQMECEACRADATPATEAERKEYGSQIPEWETVTVDGVDRLVRAYAFKDFAGALAFTNRVGEIAEEAGHHPKIVTEYGRCEVSWWSHEMGGLHKNDFILAARTDELPR
jgi:4a-hydroxytetrahydrobiopterin dehydratase